MVAGLVENDLGEAGAKVVPAAVRVKLVELDTPALLGDLGSGLLRLRLRRRAVG